MGWAWVYRSHARADGRPPQLGDYEEVPYPKTSSSTSYAGLSTRVLSLSGFSLSSSPDPGREGAMPLWSSASVPASAAAAIAKLEAPKLGWPAKSRWAVSVEDMTRRGYLRGRQRESPRRMILLN
jgi:hypothetical protein